MKELKKLKLLPKRRHNFDPNKRGVHIYILPNLLTTGNMFFGFYSMVLSLKGDFLTAAYAIVGAAVFDMLDGRVARLTHSTSKFGLEYDSLSDLVSFGVAPAILMYKWSLEPFGRVGWLAAFMYMACGALRLARFNVLVTKVDKKYFMGLPIPMAAGIVATSVMAAHETGFDVERSPYALAMAVLLGIVMVSNFRYRSFKDLDFKEKKPFFTLFVGLCVLVWTAIKPEVNLFIVFISYALLGAILGVFAPVRRKKESAAGFTDELDFADQKEEEKSEK